MAQPGVYLFMLAKLLAAMRCGTLALKLSIRRVLQAATEAAAAAAPLLLLLRLMSVVAQLRVRGGRRGIAAPN